MAPRKKKVEEPIIEAEFTEVEEAPKKKKAAAPKAQEVEVQEESGIRCAITIVQTEVGDISFNTDGSDQSLITIEGLLKYANRHMDNVWKDRFQ